MTGRHETGTRGTMAGILQEVTSPAASCHGAEAATTEALTHLVRLLARQAAHEWVEAADRSRPDENEGREA